MKKEPVVSLEELTRIQSLYTYVLKRKKSHNILVIDLAESIEKEIRGIKKIYGE